MALVVKPLTGGLGAEILGADVRDPAQFDAIFQAFTDHSVIAIRDQSHGYVANPAPDVTLSSGSVLVVLGAEGHIARLRAEIG